MFASNWAFTKEERRLLRHAVKAHKGWTYFDVPRCGSTDTRYFVHVSDIQNPVFCVTKTGSVTSAPAYEFRLPWEDAQGSAEFSDLLGKINVRLKKVLPPVIPDISLVHNG